MTFVVTLKSLKKTFLSSRIVLFPMFYLVLTPNDLKERVEVQMAVITFFFAILMGVLFEESGAKANHGNFLWKAMIANYVLLRMLSYIKRNLRSIGIFY